MAKCVWVALVGLALVSLSGCSEESATADATPCGGCSDGEVCTASGACVSTTDDCTRTCDQVGKQCGPHCGLSCGSCASGTQCVDGQCACTPSCLGQQCGAEDGCGGVCGPCPSDQNCAACALRLHVVAREHVQGVLTGFTVAIDYWPTEGAPLAGIADLRLAISGPITVAHVGLARRITDLGKTLTVDGATGRAWRTTRAGHVQLLILSPDTSAPMTAGRLAVVRFQMGTVDSPAKMPAVVSLVQREQIFAPKLADQILWSGGFGEPVSVWPEDNHAD